MKTGRLSHDELKEFDYRIIVAGSRGWSDWSIFEPAIFKYLKDHDIEKGQVCFVSGAARSGGDRLIIEWCEKHGYPWVEFHPRWDDIDAEGAVIRYKNGRPYNVLAGFWRNAEMAEVANRLISFYDGVSTGTQDMIDAMLELNHPCRTIMIHIDKEEESWPENQSK